MGVSAPEGTGCAQVAAAAALGSIAPAMAPTDLSTPPDTPDAPGTPDTPYWHKTKRLSLALLLVWLLVTLGVGLFGRALSFGFMGWPFGFWATSQGALIVFCLIIWVYAWAMDRLDQQYGDHEGD
jgi:putative solute:sodium symporter small subunit